MKTIKNRDVYGFGMEIMWKTWGNTMKYWGYVMLMMLEQFLTYEKCIKVHKASKKINGDNRLTSHYRE